MINCSFWAESMRFQEVLCDWLPCGLGSSPKLSSGNGGPFGAFWTLRKRRNTTLNVENRREPSLL